jgi:hypothetical protein
MQADTEDLCYSVLDSSDAVLFATPHYAFNSAEKPMQQ